MIDDQAPTDKETSTKDSYSHSSAERGLRHQDILDARVR